MNETRASGDKIYMMSAEAYIDLLDKLYDLLGETSNSPRLQARVVDIIRQIESLMPSIFTEEIHEQALELEMGASDSPQFSLLVAQAQQQDQQ